MAIALLAALWTATSSPAAGQLQATGSGGPSVAGITPGVSSRAEVELVLGTPASTLPSGELVYGVPMSLAGASELRVSYFTDRVVAAIEIVMSPAIPVESIAPHLGRIVHSVTNTRSQKVSYFYPSMMGLVQDANATAVVGVLYLSPRRMADQFGARAEDLRATGDLTGAVTECDKVVLIAPEYSRGYLCRGSMLTALGDDDGAMAQLLAATQAPLGGPWKARALSQLVRLFLDRGWHDRAWGALDEAKSLDAQSSAPYAAEIELLHGQGDTARALEAAEEAQLRFPDDPDVGRAHANVLFAAERFAEAAEIYERIVEAIEGNQATVYARIARGRLEAGDRSGAVEAYRRAAELGADSEEVQLAVADGLLAMGAAGEALSYYQRVVGASPGHADARRGVAASHLAMGRADAAWSALYGLYSENPSDTMTLVHLARVKAAQEEKDDALEWLERAFAAGFDDGKYVRADRYLSWLYRRDRNKFERIVGRPYASIAAAGDTAATSWGHSRRERADAEAMQACLVKSGTQCSLMRTFSLCGAYASGPGGATGVAVDDKLKDARKDAEKACRGNRRVTCTVRAAVCADGSTE